MTYLCCTGDRLHESFATLFKVLFHSLTLHQLFLNNRGKISRSWVRFIRETGNSSRKLNNSRQFFRRKASEHMGCDLRQCNHLLFLVCSADLDILCSWSFSHHVKFHNVMFMHKFSIRVVCVKGTYSFLR